MQTTGVAITQEHKEQFEREGYFVLERVIPEEQLEMLRNECALGIESMHRQMDEQGTDVILNNYRDSRYFVINRTHTSQSLRDFVLGDAMAGICRELLGPDAFMFLDQFVVKAAEKGLHFSWHQDSGYLPWDHKPYLSCWVALDDVNEENGTVYMLPYSHIGVKTRVTHIQDPNINDLVGYFGDDPGVPVTAPAGSIACFSSTCFHRSGANTTDKMRRVYLCQYSSAPLLDPEGRPILDAVPFLQDGQIVAERLDELVTA